MKIIFQGANAANFKKGRSEGIKYIVIHYTAGNGDTAKNNADYYQNNALKVSAHYFVDEGALIYQSVSDGDTAYAVGASSYVHPICRNANSISVEMCSRNFGGSGKAAEDSGWYFKEKTEENAAALVRYLMKKHGVPIENVLRHRDVTGKICPAPYVNNADNWNKFKERLKVDKISYDTTVDNMIKDGVTTAENMAYWEKVLSGREVANPEYLRVILDKYHNRG